MSRPDSLPATFIPSSWACPLPTIPHSYQPVTLTSLCLRVSVCAADFGVFGVQDGTRCFCGSPDDFTGKGYGAYGAAPESECKSQCSDPRAAAAGARCGGVDRNSIYKILDPKDPTKGLEPPVAPIAGYKHIGCFPDQTYPAQEDALPHFYCWLQDHQSLPGTGGVALECQAGVESLPAPQCAGSMDRQGFCSRRPNSQGGRSGPYMTIELCDALCSGFRYFAVQSGSMCYCGQTYGSQGNVSMPSLCNHHCTGNRSQVCGGNHNGHPYGASSVYRRLGVPLSSNEERSKQRASAHSSSLHPISPPLKLGTSRSSNGLPRKPPATRVPNHDTLHDAPPRPSCVVHPTCGAHNASVDWSIIGNGTSVIVGATRDQGNECSASWAFAAVGALESAFAIAYGKFVRGSPQSLLDCGWRYGANSCKGGDLNRAFMYAYEYGLCSEAYYQYSGTNCALLAVSPWNRTSVLHGIATSED